MRALLHPLAVGVSRQLGRKGLQGLGLRCGVWGLGLRVQLATVGKNYEATDTKSNEAVKG